MSHVALDLLARLLALDPEDRIPVEEALRHPYFRELYDEEDGENVDTFTYPEDESDSKSVLDYRGTVNQWVVLRNHKLTDHGFV